MPLFDETHVKIEGGIVVWDGMNRLEAPNDNGHTKRSLKIVINPNNPDIGLLQQLANNELQSCEFKGILPNGGLMPIGTAGPLEFNGMYPGWAVVNCSTFRMPDVYDEQGQQMNDPMQYLSTIYPGQIVDVLVHCKSYNQKSKGIAARMDGFSIMKSLNAPRQNFGGGGIDTSGAFGGQPQGNALQNNVPQQNYQQQPPQGGQPQGGYQPPQQNAPQGQPPAQNNTYQPPAQGNAPQNNVPQQNYQQQPPQGGQPQGGYQPPQQNAPQDQQQGDAPNQAHNYMPPQGGNQ